MSNEHYESLDDFLKDTLGDDADLFTSETQEPEEETRNYRIEVMFNCDGKTANKLVDEVFNAVEFQNGVDCAIVIMDDQRNEDVTDELSDKYGMSDDS